MSCGAISSTRSIVAVAGTATGTMRVCPSLIDEERHGVDLHARSAAATEALAGLAIGPPPLPKPRLTRDTG